MNAERKPTVEEMFEAYRRQSRIINEAFRRAGPPKIDFEKMPPNRRMRRAHMLRTVAAALVVGTVLSYSIMSARACKTNWGADNKGSMEMVEYMLRNQGI